MRNVHSQFKPTGLKLSKFLFVIENIQQAISENLRPIMNTRFWTTGVYKSRYFNDFVFYGLRNDILSKVFVNGMSGISWRFCRFIMLNVKVLNLDTEIIK